MVRIGAYLRNDLLCSFQGRPTIGKEHLPLTFTAFGEVYLVFHISMHNWTVIRARFMG